MSRQLAFSALLSVFLMAGFVMSGEMLPHEGGSAHIAVSSNDMNASYGDMIRVPKLPFPGLQ